MELTTFQSNTSVDGQLGRRQVESEWERLDKTMRRSARRGPSSATSISASLSAIHHRKDLNLLGLLAPRFSSPRFYLHDYWTWRGLGTSQPKSAAAVAAPNTCATMNPNTEFGAIPANVLERLRAMVTAGLAKEVDAVNQ